MTPPEMKDQTLGNVWPNIPDWFYSCHPSVLKKKAWKYIALDPRTFHAGKWGYLEVTEQTQFQSLQIDWCLHFVFRERDLSPAAFLEAGGIDIRIKSDYVWDILAYFGYEICKDYSQTESGFQRAKIHGKKAMLARSTWTSVQASKQAATSHYSY